MQKKFLILPWLLLLAACSGNDVRSAIGLEYEEPDEFVVLSRPALSVPPDFNLRPPTPGGQEQFPSTQKAAHEALIGKKLPETEGGLGEVSTVDTAVTPVLSSDTASNGESALLKRAKAEQADPQIREVLGTDVRKQEADSKGLLHRLNPRGKEDLLVDPKKETERLRNTKQQGKKINSDNVPTIDPNKKSVLDRIF
jgi:hypothetical protein